MEPSTCQHNIPSELPGRSRTWRASDELAKAAVLARTRETHTLHLSCDQAIYLLDLMDKTDIEPRHEPAIKALYLTLDKIVQYDLRGVG